MNKLYKSVYVGWLMLSLVSCIDLTHNEDPLFAVMDLSSPQASNCYIVSEAGAYKFKAVKGNSNEPVGGVVKAEVLWESFGTDVEPSVGDLVEYAVFQDDYIAFKTADAFKEGNAVIAAKDADDKILWSWHIWLTDQPQEQEYFNEAGIMMDRNLGATSATPGDVGALGLLYQWGRKDPFLGSSSISEAVEAKSTLAWPAVVETSPSVGTVDYVISHPTTFVSAPSSPWDWHYSSRDNTLWTTSDKTKSIYDPCPAGWRVPDGDDNCVWAKALGSPSVFHDESLCDRTNEGMNFSGKFGSASTIWYPASGVRSADGSMISVGQILWYCSATTGWEYFVIMGGVLLNGEVTVAADGGVRGTAHSVRCVKENSLTPTVPFPTTAIDLSLSETSNCYVVSKGDTYKFKTVKGNSNEPVGSVAKVEVLWETFGTDVEPSAGDLVQYAVFQDDYIAFKTAYGFKEGNAVIAAKDADDKILWSWHIWLTDQPQEQEYFNEAGIMMDRNLGATSATPGDVGALGLLYQWGRKDPFLGSSSISEAVEAKSTLTWPAVVETSPSVGTVDYVISHPTTFVSAPSSPWDWHYSSRDNTLWTTSDNTKSIYDPCPAGWRVPDGGRSGVWSKALGSSAYFRDESLYNSSNEGMNFSGKFGSVSTIWYPASGFHDNDGGSLVYVADYCHYWSASPEISRSYASSLYFFSDGYVYPAGSNERARGCSVRCLKENSLTPTVPFPTTAIDLSLSETSNCYVVSKGDTYKFKTVKGNSNEPVGSVAKAEVLWETFGTDVEPSVGDLVRNVSYKEGYIAFQTADTFKEGNAVIAAKDVSGNILWSWHIWLTDQPQEQEYFNEAGIMMDRNLGATSATPGDVGALGLLYQWGRKDPFLGSSSISSSTTAKSTISWPSPVSTNSSRGTVSYVTAKPTTFVTADSSSDYDWHYSSRDNTLWTTSDQTKSIYDPCPSGWRVPDGGSNDIWSKAGFDDTTYDSANEGMSFSISSPSTTWYPASGYRYDDDGGLSNVGDSGSYWSASPSSGNGNYACCLYFGSGGRVYPSLSDGRASGQSVRCLQESK